MSLPRKLPLFPCICPRRDGSLDGEDNELLATCNITFVSMNAHAGLDTREHTHDAKVRVAQCIAFVRHHDTVRGSRAAQPLILAFHAGVIFPPKLFLLMRMLEWCICEPLEVVLHRYMLIFLFQHLPRP